MNSKSQNKAIHWKSAHVAWKRPVLNGLITDWTGTLWVTLINDADVLNCELITREKCNSMEYTFTGSIDTNCFFGCWRMEII